jgi:2-phosphosulfolactate phosphatase
MIVDVALNPAEIALLPQRDLSATTCVVFDVLRATSSMVTALANGASAIHPVRTIEEALALRQRFPDALLGGERHGDPIPGFELGNSPLEYRENVKGV